MSDVASERDLEVYRLWRLLKRDLGGAILYFTGADDKADVRAYRRFRKNWIRLCAFDLDVAASIVHGITELSMMMGRNGPGDRLDQRLQEIVQVAQMGRDANPDAEVRTVGDLVALGEKAIADEIDADLDEDGSGSQSD